MIPGVSSSLVLQRQGWHGGVGSPLCLSYIPHTSTHAQNMPFCFIPTNKSLFLLFFYPPCQELISVPWLTASAEIIDSVLISFFSVKKNIPALEWKRALGAEVVLRDYKDFQLNKYTLINVHLSHHGKTTCHIWFVSSSILQLKERCHEWTLEWLNAWTYDPLLDIFVPKDWPTFMRRERWELKQLLRLIFINANVRIQRNVWS